MRSYILKRLLLMVPTLFGITMILWLVVTAAPGDPGQQAAGEAKSQRGGGGGESRKIFRAQFNLDKPLFWNSYLSLTPEEVLAKALDAVDEKRPPKVRSKAHQTLEDWGYYAVPPLMGALDLAGSPRERLVVIIRLAQNARRLGVTRQGRALTNEEIRTNREAQAANTEIEEKLTLRPASLKGPEADATIDGTAALWRDWFSRNKAQWDWSAGERLKRRLFDTQFARYWSNLLKFDLGDSHVHRKPVGRLILDRLPISVTLSVTSLILAYLISVPLGVWAAVKHRTTVEQTVSIGLFMLYSLPTFFAASLILRFFGLGQPWRIIPVQGFEGDDTFSLTTWQHVKDILWHTAAPLFCLTYVSLAAISRYAKSGLLNVIRSDYIRTARAKGLSEKSVILKHAVRNGMIPIITLLGTTLPAIIGGSIIVESVFRIPGMGYLIFDSISQRDYNVVIGETLLVAVLTMVGILFSDIIYAIVDPRISYS